MERSNSTAYDGRSRTRLVPAGIRRVVRTGALSATLLALGAATHLGLAFAAGEHTTTPPVPPAPSDARFMPGTTGPIVVKGTAQTVLVPDGPGVDGESGRTQNDGDLRKNNYSVTDANFNNRLGLLPDHPDTGAPMTYVQHIQTYAAAGYLEAFAPDMYAHLVMHQNGGQGTVLGGAAYLMGLVRASDAAAHGLDVAAVPRTLPGSPVEGRHYVRSGRDITGQNWARMHHAQTSPNVYRSLVEAGVNWSTALVLAGDDGISGSGRLNGVNNQDGLGGFNSDERALWSLAAQVQQQTGIPVVQIMMGGHDHAGLHSSALTIPKINAVIGFSSTDRSASPERAEAIYQSLLDGRVGSVQLVGDDKFTARNEFLLRQGTDVDLNLDWPDHMHDVGTTFELRGDVENDGPHITTDATLRLTLPRQLSLVSLTVGGRACTATCAVGRLGYGERVPVRILVRVVAHGEATFSGAVSSSEVDHDLDDNVQERDYAFRGMSRMSAWSSTVTRTRLACGTRATSPCIARHGTYRWVSGVLTPASNGGTSGRRWVRVKWYQRTSSGAWVLRVTKGAQVDAAGRWLTRTSQWDLGRGTWRAQASADDTWLTTAATSTFTYVTVR